MLPSLTVELSSLDGSRSLSQIVSDLEQRLAKLDLRKQRALAQAISDYMLQQTHQRLQQQQDIYGAPFKRRKYRRALPGKRKRGQPKQYGRLLPAEMLLGFNASDELQSYADAQMNIHTGYQGFMGKIASWHNEGLRGSDRKARPQRQWLGISPRNEKAIMAIIEKHLAQD